MKKKLISGLISLVMLLSLLPMSITATAADENFQGEGTAESPYLISTAEDLTKLSSLTNAASTNEKYGAAHYKLTADIDMIGATFAGLNCMDTAWNYRYFTGVFDGDGHVIKNITISSTSNRARGFISVASGATVRNLGIENISIKGGAMGGIIAQDMGAKSTVENCYVRGLTATKNVSYETVAGIVGYAQSTDGSKTTITNCYAVGLSANSVRAIIGYDTANGYQSHGNLTNCYANLSDNVVGLGGTAVNCFASTTANGVTAEALGEAFKEDTKGKNGGYPLLSWETEANFEGEGTEETPYLLNDANDLVKLATLTNTTATAADYADKVYKLTADIDMTGISYKPVSWATSMYTVQGAAFTGTLDGNNHIIKNISFTNLATYGSTYGIIGFISANGVVKNLGVENMTVNGGAANRLCIGGIAGSLGAPVTIENCYVRGMSVTTTSTDATYVGGIAGRTIGTSGTIKNCYATGLDFTKVTREGLKAGILGSSGNVNYKAENCYTTDAKLQGNTAATNSYMVTTNCYTSSTLANATVANLGEAFKADLKAQNNGYPLLSWETEKEPFEGEGTEEKPYIIATANDMVKLSLLTNGTATAADYADKVYKLTADIDMTGISYKPVSWATSMYTVQGAAFTGTLDGNKHIIKNISFTNLATYGSTYGIIGFISANGVVKNLGVENMTVNGGAANRLCIGGIAGSLGSPVTIENCYVRGMSVTTTSTDATYVGGIAGRTIGNEGIIKNCYATGLDFTKVTREGLKAGILGSSGNVNYKAENCYTTDAHVQGNTAATNSYMGTTNCYAGKTVELLTADVLGVAFDADNDLLNEGMPVLVWEYNIAHPETVYYTVKSGETEITGGASNVSAKNPVVITFEDEMNVDTFSKIQIFKGDAKLDDCVFDIQSDKVISIKINTEYNTEYTIFIPKTVQSVKDENGKSAKADEKKIKFRIEPMPKAVMVEYIKINGQSNAPSNLTAGTEVTVEAEVKNTGELSSQPVALVVALFGQDGIMKYAALDTANVGNTNETLKVEFVVPQNAGVNPIVNVMVWDSITKMNAMR